MKIRLSWCFIANGCPLYRKCQCFSFHGHLEFNSQQKNMSRRILLFFDSTANGLLPGGSGTTHRNTHMTQNNTAHETSWPPVN
jgi:hypothetical protein